MIWIILAFVGGVTVGTVINAVLIRMRTIGNIRVDQSDPTEPPYLFLELSEGVHTIMSKKTVHFNVRVENYVSQK